MRLTDTQIQNALKSNKQIVNPNLKRRNECVVSTVGCKLLLRQSNHKDIPYQPTIYDLNRNDWEVVETKTDHQVAKMDAEYVRNTGEPVLIVDNFNNDIVSPEYMIVESTNCAFQKTVRLSAVALPGQYVLIPARQPFTYKKGYKVVSSTVSKDGASISYCLSEVSDYPKPTLNKVELKAPGVEMTTTADLVNFVNSIFRSK